MRACVGLAPWYEPPLGLPVKPAAAAPPAAPAQHFQACMRDDCPCTASYNGLAGEYCGQTWARRARATSTACLACRLTG
eukprot:582590-Prymnesium_polylepis.1